MKTAVDGSTHGDRIRSLLDGTQDPITFIAPFIKKEALRSLLRVIPKDTTLRCVTRWLPREVAAGVSDPEIFEELEQRGSFTLTLVDNLHAKLYIVGDQCLAGSANLTLSGLGDVDNGNIEVLLRTTIHNPDIAATLAAIRKAERPASRHIAEAARALADKYVPSLTAHLDPIPWFPHSRRVENVYRFYSQPPDSEQFLTTSDRMLLADIANTNMGTGLSDTLFRKQIRALLQTIPLAASLLDNDSDITLTKADALPHLTLLENDNIGRNDLWIAFVNWMVFFFPGQVMKQEITEIALRRAQRIS